MTSDLNTLLIGFFGQTAPKFDGKQLHSAGAVGTGFTEAVAESLRKKLDIIRVPRSPIAGLKLAGAVWVAPDLQAEVAYRGTTKAGELRQASFKGLVEN